MEERSLNRDKVDWRTIRSAALEAAAGAQTPSETYVAIAAALSALGDDHSRFIAPMPDLPEDLERVMAAQTPPRPEARRINERVGYVRVPGFSSRGSGGSTAKEFARRILDSVLEVDAPDVCGWIVDVRGNTGGNMWPMLQGLSLILGDGVPGYFVPPEGPWTPWRVDREGVGAATLSHPHPAVAILHDSVTASSGEAVVVAFRGRPQTRSFGQRTHGLSTANSTIPLADGATLILTVAVFADRDKNVYGGAIQPDEPVPLDTPEPEILAAASGWLLQQPACLAGHRKRRGTGGVTER